MRMRYTKFSCCLPGNRVITVKSVKPVLKKYSGLQLRVRGIFNFNRKKLAFSNWNL